MVLSVQEKLADLQENLLGPGHHWIDMVHDRACSTDMELFGFALPASTYKNTSVSLPHPPKKNHNQSIDILTLLVALAY